VIEIKKDNIKSRFSLHHRSSGVPNSEGGRDRIGCGNQNDGAGILFAAVAHTENGEIPGKANDKICWYPYNGKEEQTNNFSFVMIRTWKLVKSEFVPLSAIQTGNQNGMGKLFAAVAHTEHGDIPGKAKDKLCWYPYNGKEEQTNNFSWVISTWELVHDGLPPKDSIPCGNQDGDGLYWSAVAHTEDGDIPGKAQNNTCWYPYNGKEVQTNNFSWLVAYHWRIEKGDQPPKAIPCGRQTDGAGIHFAAIAHTDFGDIPGKAKGKSCWYTYKGKEKTTKNFSWIVIDEEEPINEVKKEPEPIIEIKKEPEPLIEPYPIIIEPIDEMKEDEPKPILQVQKGPEPIIPEPKIEMKKNLNQ